MVFRPVKQFRRDESIWKGEALEGTLGAEDLGTAARRPAPREPAAGTWRRDFAQRRAANHRARGTARPATNLPPT